MILRLLKTISFELKEIFSLSQKLGANSVTFMSVTPFYQNQKCGKTVSKFTKEIN